MRHGFKQLKRSGYTLVEMVAVIAITGIIAATVAVFLRVPLQSYQDAQRRASITDAADTVFTLVKRDLQSALPNSVRVTNAGAVFYLEFLQTRTGGRYRADNPTPAVASSANTCPDTSGDGLADENVLQFGVADTCFTTLGSIPGLTSIVASSDFVAVYNLGPGFTSADAYASGNVTGGNKSLITSAATGSGGENVVRFQSNTFDLESPGRRFHVISGAVSYVCDPSAGTLRRFSGYAISAAQPTPPAGSSAVLAKGISACTITYDQNVINQRTGIASVWLTFSDPNATSVRLFQQVQVSNVPVSRYALRAQRGFTLVAGIFLITMLFLLSAYMVGFRVYQEAQATLDVQGTRAYAAARAGTEWGAYNSLRNNTCAATTAIPLGGSLTSFTATVTCSRSTYNEGGTTISIDTIVANACNQPAAGNCPNAAPGIRYSERQVTLTVGQ